MTRVFRVFGRSIIVGLFAVFSVSASAQHEIPNEPSRSQTIILKAASYVDTQQGKLIRPAIIVIDQGRISGINPQQFPEGATVVDLGEATLLPGLIDAHTHLMIGTSDTNELFDAHTACERGWSLKFP